MGNSKIHADICNHDTKYVSQFTTWIYADIRPMKWIVSFLCVYVLVIAGLED